MQTVKVIEIFRGLTTEHHLDSGPCRTVFPEMPILLCLFHVLKAWMEQLRSKVRSKDKFSKVLKALYALVLFCATETAEQR